MIENRTDKEKRSIKDYLKKANGYRRQYPIIYNIILISLAFLAFLWILLIFIDSWTLHGEEQEIPDVKGMNINVARGILQKEGLETIIGDSIFDSSQLSGTVVDQNPRPLSKVKAGRSVYLTIVAYSPKMVRVPDVMNTSLRQGQSMLEGIGLKNILITRVPSEYEDLVLGIRLDGKELTPGDKIPVNSVISLEVGAGMQEEEDSLEDPEEISSLYD